MARQLSARTAESYWGGQDSVSQHSALGNSLAEQVPRTNVANGWDRLGLVTTEPLTASFPLTVSTTRRLRDKSQRSGTVVGHWSQKQNQENRYIGALPHNKRDDGCGIT